ncbi:MAG: helical backbone metal receptor [Bryobacteraceae bacterium]
MMRLIFCFLLLAAVLVAQPKRIVSTAPSITETLFALGLGDRVVGVTNYCHYPAATAKIAKIGTYMQPNLEVILALKPDLIITQKTAIHSKSRFEPYHLNVLEVTQNSIAEIQGAISAIGEAAGARSAALTLNASITKELAAVSRKAATKPPVSVVFIVGRTPNALEGMVAVGSHNYLTEVMEVAGGRNSFGDAAPSYAKISAEEILSRNPQVILDMGDMSDPTGVTEEHKREVVKLWGRYPNVAAVRDNRVHAIASEIFVVPGPRVIELARAFAHFLHPELFP